MGVQLQFCFTDQCWISLIDGAIGPTTLHRCIKCDWVVLCFNYLPHSNGFYLLGDIKGQWSYIQVISTSPFPITEQETFTCSHCVHVVSFTAERGSQ